MSCGMDLSTEDAFNILKLPAGVDQDSIRTSYKRLSLKWHPDKHGSSQEALTKFKLISRSYLRLTNGQSANDMTLEKMLSLFKEVFLARPVNSYNGSGYDSSSLSDDDVDEDEDDIEQELKNSNLLPDKIKLKQDWKKSREESNVARKTLSPEEIGKNADELITEEEKEKKKAEKRRAKKKRRREKKKLLRQDADKRETTEDKKSAKQKTKNAANAVAERKKKTDSKTSTSSDEAGFDRNSAFFTKVVNKKKKSPPGEAQVIKPKKEKGDKSDEDEELDPNTLRSRQLAIKGNEMAHLEHYTAAIELFSEAIKLDPKDFRFFGNRSYCYDRLQQYEKALKDAEKAIHLAKDWPKGYFRQGRALAGLKQFIDAEMAFTQVLKLDKNCEDAVQELLRVKTHQIMEMGFTSKQAEAAIKRYGTVQAALDSLLVGVVAENLTTDREVYLSDDEDGFLACSQAVQPRILLSNDNKMDPKNPEGLTALWVGNVLPDVSDKKLQQMFARYGQVKSVRCLPEKYCAFVNFSTKEAAGKAMVALQGVECGGQRLLIKFPDHPIANGNDQGTITLRKPPITAPKSNGTVAIVAAVTSNLKVTGPVNGNECYFWRTTGCIYGDKCRNLHIPANRGIDKMPW